MVCSDSNGPLSPFSLTYQHSLTMANLLPIDLCVTSKMPHQQPLHQESAVKLWRSDRQPESAVCGTRVGLGLCQALEGRQWYLLTEELAGGRYCMEQ